MKKGIMSNLKNLSNIGDLGNLVSGMAGNLSQMNIESVKSEYGKYLLDGEEIVQAYSLIRDMTIFTDIRMISIDKQGATGRKMSVKSIFLMNIVDCSMETAGTGIDDSEITITFLDNIKRDAHNQTVSTHKLEFPKKMDIAPLYTWIFGLAYKNRLEINGVK